MKIEIIGSRCATCRKYSQYYHQNYNGIFEAIDCGYCGERSRNTRPGDRCGRYEERSNIMSVADAIKMSQGSVQIQ